MQEQLKEMLEERYRMLERGVDVDVYSEEVKQLILKKINVKVNDIISSFLDVKEVCYAYHGQRREKLRDGEIAGVVTGIEIILANDRDIAEILGDYGVRVVWRRFNLDGTLEDKDTVCSLEGGVRVLGVYGKVI